MSFIINPYRFSFYDPDYQAVLDRATTLGYTHPSDAKKTTENSFMVAIKAVFSVSAIASAPIVQGLMFKTTGDSDYATLNWVNPAIRQATKVNSPTFTSDLGFNSNGTTSYLDSNVAITVLTQSDFSVAARTYTDSFESSALLGMRDAAGVTTESLVLAPRIDVGNNHTFRFIDNTTSVTSIGGANATVRWIIGRTDASNAHYSSDGSGFTNIVKTLDAAENARNIFLLAVNNADSGAISLNTRGISYCWLFSRKLTNGEAAAFDAAIVNYLA